MILRSQRSSKKRIFRMPLLRGIYPAPVHSLQPDTACARRFWPFPQNLHLASTVVDDSVLLW